MKRAAVSVFKANRLGKLPPYLFVEIDAMKEKAVKAGKDVIDLGVGDPDKPTPNFVLKAMIKALKKASNHTYPTNKGLASYREAIAAWMKKRFGVRLDPATEILPVMGTKEGIAHLPLGLVNPGDHVLVPDPGYPPYMTGTILAGGRPVGVPLLARNQFLPDLDTLKRHRGKAKLLFLNYPNNPTAAVASPRFFRELVRFARTTRIPICHDAAYSEVYFGRKAPVSFLQTAGAKEVGIEFHSLSKTFNMTGWRIGWVCGNQEMIAQLAQVKSNIDSGIFQAVQEAGITALRQGSSFVTGMRRLYKDRRNLFIDALQAAGWQLEAPEATFYIWAPLPGQKKSKPVAKQILQESHIVATPGVGFGRCGEGYVRFSLSVPTPRLKQAASRLKRLSVWPKASSR